MPDSMPAPAPAGTGSASAPDGAADSASDSAAGTSSTPAQAAADAYSKADVDIGDKASLARWSAALGVTSEALESAVKAVGPRVDKIKDFLTGGAAAQQSDA